MRLFVGPAPSEAAAFFVGALWIAPYRIDFTLARA